MKHRFLIFLIANYNEPVFACCLLQMVHPPLAKDYAKGLLKGSN
ncbi:hypothetical protein UNH65_29350 [Chitinophaga sp. 180180018-2]|nr:hypothetical protein [Chitinophaga sp. 212800010-3]